MKTLTIHRLSLQSHAPGTCPNPKQTARALVDTINAILFRAGLGAELIDTPDEIEVTLTDDETEAEAQNRKALGCASTALAWLLDSTERPSEKIRQATIALRRLGLDETRPLA